MPTLLMRVEGPDPPAMTCHDVARSRIAAFMACPGAGIFSFRASRMPPNDRRERAGAFDGIVFAAEVPGRDGPATRSWSAAAGSGPGGALSTGAGGGLASGSPKPGTRMTSSGRSNARVGPCDSP